MTITPSPRRDRTDTPPRRSVARRAVVRVAVTAVLVGTSACTTSRESHNAGSGNSTTEVPTTTPGKEATGTPVTIGFVNSDTGAVAVTDISDGAKLAVERINKHEDGINGHPIQLIACPTDGTPESSASCANKLVAEHVVAVVDGADLGTDSKVPILRDAGIATMGNSTLGKAQALNQDAFFWAPAVTSYPAAEIDLAARVGAKKVTMLLPDVPQTPLAADIAAKQAELNGIGFELVKFDQAAPDFDAAMTAITANGSGAVAAIATDDWCTSIVRSAKSTGFTGSLIVGTCSRFVEDLGAKETEGIYRLAAIWGPTSRSYAPDGAREVLDQYSAAMEEAGAGDRTVGLTWGGYSAMILAAGVLRTVTPDLTAANVMAAMHALNDGPNPLGQPITCDPRPFPGFSACTEGWLMFRQQPDGTSKPVVDEFVKPKT